MLEQFILYQNFIFSAPLLKAHYFLLLSALHFLLIHQSPIVTNLPPCFQTLVPISGLTTSLSSLSLSVLILSGSLHWISVFVSPTLFLHQDHFPLRTVT